MLTKFGNDFGKSRKNFHQNFKQLLREQGGNFKKIIAKGIGG